MKKEKLKQVVGRDLKTGRFIKLSEQKMSSREVLVVGISTVLFVVLILYPLCRWMPFMLSFAVFVLLGFAFYRVMYRFASDAGTAINFLTVLFISLLFVILSIPIVFAPLAICSKLFFKN